MATKKSTKTAKTKTSKTVKTKSPAKKSPAKSAPRHHPHHICFGAMTMVTGFAIFLALLVGLAYCIAKSQVPSDAEKFSAEYSQVEEDNLFVYKTGAETIEILEKGTGVVFLGFPECPWCQAYAPMLNDLAKAAGLEKIYYHNTLSDWKNNTEEYQKITEILSSNLQYDDEGNRHLYVPDAVFVKDGVIIGNDFETSKDTDDAETPEEYWTSERVEDFKTRISSFLSQLK